MLKPRLWQRDAALISIGWGVRRDAYVQGSNRTRGWPALAVAAVVLGGCSGSGPDVKTYLIPAEFPSRRRSCQPDIPIDTAPRLSTSCAPI